MHNNRYQIISLRTSERRSISSSVSDNDRTTCKTYQYLISLVRESKII